MPHYSKRPLLTGTLILTLAGLTSRIIGFFYRIFLSHTIGAEGLGIYQLIFPVYTFCFALVVFGIQTGISRCCAASFAENKPYKAFTYFSVGFFCSFILSIAASLILHHYSGEISQLILKEARCQPMLELISYSIPLGTIHICISAWYYARKKTGVPAASQLLEQIVRVCSTYMLYLIFIEKNVTPSPLLAAFGILAGEAASSLFSSIFFLLQISFFKQKKHTKYSYRKAGKELFFMSAPLTANKMLITILQSSEAILIPLHLKKYGLTSFQALSIYGILTGMSLPFILFPSVITNSVSTMLLPAIAGEQAMGKQIEIKKAAEQTIKYCLMLGIFASGIFFFFGDSLGQLVYNNKDAGTFIRILSFLCPFLYLTGTLSSILNGLGHTFLCFLQNFVGLTIRILFVIWGIPHFGITGYLWGLLASQLAITVLNLWFVYHKVRFCFYPFSWIGCPFCSLTISCGISLFFYHLLLKYSWLPPLFSLGIGISTCGVLYLLILSALGLIHFTLPSAH